MSLWLSSFLFVFMVILLVVILLRIERFLFSLELVWWKFSALVAHQIYLCCLGVTCHLLDKLGCGFIELSIFLASYLTLVAGNLFMSMLLSFIVLRQISQKKSLCRIMAVSCGYLANTAWVCTALYHSSPDLSPYQKLASKSNLALTSSDRGLQNSSNFSQMVARLSSPLDRFHETYCSIPHSSLQAITFLHFLLSASMASSHSRMFSHFKNHFKNLWYKPSLTVQSILGP